MAPIAGRMRRSLVPIVGRRQRTITEGGLAAVGEPPVSVGAGLKRGACPEALVCSAISPHTAPREGDVYIARNHNFGVGQALLFHQCIEPCGVGRFEPHAAVRCGAANPAGAEGAVDRMALWA